MTVEVAPGPERSPAQLTTLLSACNDAARGGQCRLASKKAASDAPADAVAVVTWNGDWARVEVWRHRGRAGFEPPRARELEFDATNPPLERWRTLGFVAGTLASDTADEEAARARTAGEAPAEGATLTGGERAPSDSAEARTRHGAPPERSAGSRTTLRPAGRSLWVDLASGTGPGFDSGPFRLGGLTRVSYVVSRSFVRGSLGYFGQSNGQTGFSARWLSGSLGVGHRPWSSSGGLGLDLRLEAVVQSVRASVSAPQGAGNDSADIWQTGLRVGCDAVWEAVPGFSAFLGVDLAGFVGPVHVTVAEDRVGTLAALGGTVVGGLRLTFPLTADRGAP